MTDQTITATGVNGRMAFDGSLLTITRKGIGNKGQKTIPLASVGGIQIRPATMLANGFIQLSVVGEVSRSKGGIGRLQNAANDENAIIFTKKHTPEIEAFRDAVLAAQSVPTPTPAQPDVADQLAKLATLRDSGVLTEDEFAAAKTELLERL